MNTVKYEHTGFSEGPHFTFNSNDPGISERFQTLKSLTKTPPGTQSSNTISETSVFRTDRQTVELNCTLIFWFLILVASPFPLSTLSPRILAEKLRFPLTWKISVTFALRRFKGSFDSFCLVVCRAQEVCQPLKKVSVMVSVITLKQSDISPSFPRIRCGKLTRTWLISFSSFSFGNPLTGSEGRKVNITCWTCLGWSITSETRFTVLNNCKPRWWLH